MEKEKYETSLDNGDLAPILNNDSIGIVTLPVIQTDIVPISPPLGGR